MMMPVAIQDNWRISKRGVLREVWKSLAENPHS
jgi:hypothetical protein